MITNLTMTRRHQGRKGQLVQLSNILFLSVSSLCLVFLSIMLATTVVAEEEDWVVGVDGDIVSQRRKDVPQRTIAESDDRSEFEITMNELFELMEITDHYGEKQALEYPYESENEEENVGKELNWKVVKSRVMEMDRYMKERRESVTESQLDCRNSHQHCIAWASLKECGRNPVYMLANCAPSCRACEGSVDKLPAQDLVRVYGVPQLGLLEEKPDVKYDDTLTPEYLASSVRDMHKYMKHVDSTVPCLNNHENCLLWSLQGHCETHAEYMSKECAPSCRTCPRIERELEEEKNVELYGEQQLLTENNLNAAEAKTLLDKMNNYMRDVVFGNESYASARETCRNQHANCLYWAHLGECVNNPSYMHTNCAPACEVCEKKGSYELRCGQYPFSENILKPGDLDRMFERLTTDPWFVEQYNPTILGGPGITAKIHGKEDQPTPWIVTLDNFLTEEECEAMIELGHKQGYNRSLDIGDVQPDGSMGIKENQRRTSTNAWCLPPCFDDPVTKKVLEKIEYATGVPDNYSEYLQLLRYEPEQFYEAHHDYIVYPNDRLQGPRILTVFLYLNDVEAGGGTRFTDLDLTVMPKRGRALLWPSVLSDLPEMKDIRTHHEALAVEKGIKFGANAWLHLRDFKFPYNVSCL